MGMLIRRHRDRHKTEVAPEQAAEGPSRNSLRAEAKALGLSTAGSKTDLAERIAAHMAEHGKQPNPEDPKDPDTEPDPGAGGDNPEAPAPEDGTGDPDESAEDDTPEDNSGE